ncbi:putative ABC transporter [Magnetofaba australis IT-1]|uniref:Putative ABC transporter n=1 Tax=Magnetofaba australis IT-1 TaxID=1434232 RepID=A0A1Y2K766_9PROT|nr:putative ABC transporter [Magnetofaba australis IT-1]
MRNLSAHAEYGNGALFQGVSFELNPGESLAITAPEGGGKSHLLRLLAGLETPSAGEILLDGRPIASIAEPIRARRLGVVFSQPWEQFIAHDPWREVAMGVLAQGVESEALKQRVTQALQQTPLPQSLWRAPLERLSHGQAYWVMFAAALAMQPALLLLDEPGALLSETGEAHLVDLLHAQPQMARIVFTSRAARAQRMAAKHLSLGEGLGETNVK